MSIAKMQKAREMAAQNQPFFEESLRLITFAGDCAYVDKHPYIDGRPVQSTLMVVISGDRGLCGGYNAGVIRYATRYMETLGHPAKVIAIGSKAGDAFKRHMHYRPVNIYRGLTDSPIYGETEEIAKSIQEFYDEGEVDRVMLCYTQFSSMLVQQPHIVQLLPLEAPPIAGLPASYEPGGAEMLSSLVSFYLASRLYGAILESALCEQSARVLSMDGASRTAGEMITSLSLRYNRARQDLVTREITEIVAGADASNTLRG